jgi:hypothetical protein
MSDTFLSRFQKSAEQFGVRGGEDSRYIGMQKVCRENGPRWKYYTNRIFRRNKKGVTVAEPDIENGPQSPTTGDDIMRQEILEEVESIRKSVDQQVDAELGFDNANTKALQREIAHLDGSEKKMGVRRRVTRLDDDGDADDEGIDDDDVEDAFRAARGGSS